MHPCGRVENYQQQCGDQAEPRPEHGGMFQQHGATAQLTPSLFACSLCSCKKKKKEKISYQHKCHYKLGRFYILLNILERAPFNTHSEVPHDTHLRGLRAASSYPRTLRHGANSPPFIVTSAARITVYCSLFTDHAPTPFKMDTNSFRNVGKAQKVSKEKLMVTSPTSASVTADKLREHIEDASLANTQAHVVQSLTNTAGHFPLLLR